ncbi:MAG: hypothetical protein ABJL35_03585 [Parasphingorhabdus sp.]|uniref:hypothetical protein n=1 Tax=Parasphingorhabdus sp. TaxID=2709688 RepID=UPI003299E1EF
MASPTGVDGVGIEFRWAAMMSSGVITEFQDHCNARVTDGSAMASPRHRHRATIALPWAAMVSAWVIVALRCQCPRNLRQFCYPSWDAMPDPLHLMEKLMLDA